MWPWAWSWIWPLTSFYKLIFLMENPNFRIQNTKLRSNVILTLEMTFGIIFKQFMLKDFEGHCHVQFFKRLGSHSNDKLSTVDNSKVIIRDLSKKINLTFKWPWKLFPMSWKSYNQVICKVIVNLMFERWNPLNFQVTLKVMVKVKFVC